MKIRFKITFYTCLMILLASRNKFVHPIETESDGHVLPLESEIVSEVNLARTNPREYASSLEELRQCYDGKLLKRPGETPVVTQEGVSAVDEAIQFLRSENPLPPLGLSRGMSLGAKDHVMDIGPAGDLGHKGSDGSQPWDRINRYGIWREQVGENISYGGDETREVIMKLIIDDGVPGRGHRENIFNPNFRFVGVACGYHGTYKTMCVVTFAEDYAEKGDR